MLISGRKSVEIVAYQVGAKLREVAALRVEGDGDPEVVSESDREQDTEIDISARALTLAGGLRVRLRRSWSRRWPPARFGDFRRSGDLRLACRSCRALVDREIVGR